MRTKGYLSPIAIHPGVTLKEMLEELNMTHVELCNRTGIAEKTISEIVNGKNPITIDTASKFERVFGISKDFWINLQVNFEKDKLRLAEISRLDDELKYLSDFSCYPELAGLGVVKKTIKPKEKVEELLNFFSVHSLKFVDQAYPINFRISQTPKINKFSLLAWLRIGEIEAKEVETKDYDKKELIKSIPRLRELTKQTAEIFSIELKKELAKCGIILIYVPHLINTYVNGATMWLKQNKPLIILSLRNRYSDIFWFTLFHELGHLYYGKKNEINIDFKGKENSKEEELADKFSQNYLIETRLFTKFMSTMDYRKLGYQINKFANEIGIAPGIIAGRIGNETGEWKRVSRFRSKLNFTN